MLAILVMQLIEFIARHQYHRASTIVNSSEPPTDKEVDAVKSEPTPVEVQESHGHSHGLSLLQEKHNHRVSTYLLEFGIAMHSVLDWFGFGHRRRFHIHCSFHWPFVSINSDGHFFLHHHPGLGLPLALPFARTISIRNSLAALITVGVLDLVSGGILIYVALVNLIADEIGPTAHEFFALNKRFKFLYFAALYLGAALMAVIGRWA